MADHSRSSVHRPAPFRLQVLDRDLACLEVMKGKGNLILGPLVGYIYRSRFPSAMNRSAAFLWRPSKLSVGYSSGHESRTSPHRNGAESHHQPRRLLTPSAICYCRALCSSSRPAAGRRAIPTLLSPKKKSFISIRAATDGPQQQLVAFPFGISCFAGCAGSDGTP